MNYDSGFIIGITHVFAKKYTPKNYLKKHFQSKTTFQCFLLPTKHKVIIEKYLLDKKLMALQLQCRLAAHSTQSGYSL